MCGKGGKEGKGAFCRAETEDSYPSLSKHKGEI